MSAKSHASDEGNDYRIKGGGWANAWKIALVLGVIGMAGSLAGVFSDPSRAMYSYLFAFTVGLTIALGSLFFVMIQHVVSAHWSVTVRRTAEFFASGLFLFAILFAPIYLKKEELYPWMTHHAAEHKAEGAGESASAGEKHEGEAATPSEPTAGVEVVHAGEHADPLHAAHARMMEDKKWYLTVPFFSLRMVLYFIIWGYFGWRMLNLSTSQDDKKLSASARGALTNAQKKTSTGGLFLFALSLTFAAFDWLMGLDPAWSSTIFGVWIFAGCIVAMYATLVLTTMSLRNAGHLGKAVNVEHYHDLGKLMFGFNVFWAYIGFAQFFLIWYASIPEETPFYHIRWGLGPWRYVSLSIAILHFVVPFFLLLSRNIKRRLPLLALGSALLLVMHVVEIYWLVLPNFLPKGLAPDADRPFAPNHWDILSLVGILGVYLAWVFWKMTQHALIPVGDPRLKRSLHFENA